MWGESGGEGLKSWERERGGRERERERENGDRGERWGIESEGREIEGNIGERGREGARGEIGGVRGG